MAKKVKIKSPYREIIDEIKETIPKHEKGELLEEPDKEEMKERAAEKEIRKKELEEVEKALRDKQVKFLATEEELNELKKAARLIHTSQSEFIRSAIWEKIESVTGRTREKTQERVITEELKEIKKRLTKLETREKE